MQISHILIQRAIIQLLIRSSENDFPSCIQLFFGQVSCMTTRTLLSLCWERSVYHYFCMRHRLVGSGRVIRNHLSLLSLVLPRKSVTQVLPRYSLNFERTSTSWVLNRDLVSPEKLVGSICRNVQQTSSMYCSHLMAGILQNVTQFITAVLNSS